MLTSENRVSRRRIALATAAVAVVGAAGCSSSGSSTATPGLGATGGASLTPITVGVLTDLTGPAASASVTTVDGVKAGTYYAARQGYKIKYVVADTQTNPASTLAGAQKLVTQDHVDVVLAESALTLLAAPYLTAHRIPVIGTDVDGPEWLTAKNMFAVFGALNPTKSITTMGKFFKMEGVTSLGSLGYGVSAVSAGAAKGFATSAKAAGLKVGYANTNFPFGSANVVPVSIAMRQGGVNGVALATTPATAFALITALRNQGVPVKAAVLAAGYGSDLLGSGPGATQAAQNVVFAIVAQPFALQTAATKQMASDLRSAGITTAQPTLAQYSGYLSVGLLVKALKAAGPHPTKPALIKELSGMHTWDGLGLFGGINVDINDHTSYVTGPNNCYWMTRFVGTSFQPVAGASPICGELLPG